ncbi:MAG: hypothetical protein ACRCZP_16740 [Phycicoccus sp.]
MTNTNTNTTAAAHSMRGPDHVYCEWLGDVTVVRSRGTSGFNLWQDHCGACGTKIGSMYTRSVR